MALILFVATDLGAADGALADRCAVKPTSSLVVDVKTRGAKGDGKTNDTKAIQKAIDEVGGTGGTVYVPKGTYMVRGTGKGALRLRSKMTLKLADGAMLRIIPNGAERYNTLKIVRVSDVAVVGGTLHGDRKEHKDKKGEWGMGIRIGPDAKRVTIFGVTAQNMWGDGFYVNGAVDTAFCSVAAINNRRQGMSIIEANGLLVTDSVFRDTHGTDPATGVDLEPNKPEDKITNVRIERSKFIRNEGGGIMIAGKKARIANVEITHNVFEANRPILVENAPAVRSSSICNNRSISQVTAPSQGFNAYAEPIDMVAFQMNCKEGSDLRFEKNRMTKKKNKK